MLTPVVFLPLAAVLINDVKADAREGEVTVEIVTSEPVATSAVRVSSGGPHRLYVYLDGSAANQMSFGQGIIVHPRARYTKLEIPTDDRCGEPIGMMATSDGIRVRATCRAASATHGSVSSPAQLQAAAHAEHPLPDAPKAALLRDKQTQTLRAALALPAEVPTDDGAASAGESGIADGRAAAKAPAPEKAIAAAPAKSEPVAQAKPGAAQVAPQKVAVDPPGIVAPTVANQDTSGFEGKSTASEPKSGSGVLATVVGVVLLLAVGLAGVLLGRRRAGRSRVIRIVETASIGPRRSLVVACVGGRTMVLGVSEAGVSLLDSPAAPPATVDGLTTKASGGVEDAAMGLRNLALASGAATDEQSDEPKNETSLLGRLFRRKPRESEGLGHEDFEALFAESLEDEELRRKLAMGQSGRTA